MSRRYLCCRLVVCSVTACSVLSPAVFAIDYIPSWPFTVPLGEQGGDSPIRELLIYDSLTGNLTYDTRGDRSWTPPNLASRSGQFVKPTDGFAPVPLVFLPAPWLDVNETLGDVVTEGSNGIHVNYDPLAFWPDTYDSPQTLAHFGLTNVPSEYGNVLPTGLSVAELQLDVYAGVFGSDAIFDVHDIQRTWIGDANFDGEFSSSDLVAIFKANKYEVDLPASWSEGDWNNDDRFDSSDLVAALEGGGYESGPLPAARTVPEPRGLAAVFFAVSLMILHGLKPKFVS